MSSGKGPWGACLRSQCLSTPGCRLKLGQRGARRPLNLRANWGAGVKGAWQAGGAIMAKNGRLSAPADKEDGCRLETSTKFSAALACQSIHATQFPDEKYINNKQIIFKNKVHYAKRNKSPSVWCIAQTFHFFLKIYFDCYAKMLNPLSDGIIQKQRGDEKNAGFIV